MVFRQSKRSPCKHARRGRGVLGLAALLALAVAGAAAAQFGFFGGGMRLPANPDYDGRFTFTRLRYGPNGAWSHDYPRADQHLVRILAEITLIKTNTDAGNVLRLDDPGLFKYPIAYMSEPGFWRMSDAEALNLRQFLLKGGFIIFDDFEGRQWNNLEEQMRRVLPESRWVQIDVPHPLFGSFFEMKTVNFPHPMYNLPPHYYVIFEDNDPNKRVVAIANHDNDVAEYWEWSDRGLFPIDFSNEAYKLGVNYIIYGLTH
jgi:hypothetical protein